MTSPALAFPLRGRGRHYPYPACDPSDWPLNQWRSVNPEDVPDHVTPLPSITNILDVLDAPALRGWYAEQALRGLYGSGSLPVDCDEAVSRFKWAANKVRDDRAEEGTSAHDLMEQVAAKHEAGEQDFVIEAPAHLGGYLTAGLNFWRDHQPDPIYVEATVANPDAGYAGTGDLFAHIGTELVVADYKTRAGEPDDKKTKKYGLLYESNRLQLAALAHAPYRMFQDREGWTSAPMPKVTAGMGVVLYESGDYRIETLDAKALARFYRAFCGLVTAWTELKAAA